ncbi:iron-siderophore ABC transporter substrate-binding protein [Paenibacillus sp. P96]|uniref:Iron-siderophore ABC transporter substrate-binding protein n=1 Tax=Paenibacillus zeirhizosphaerae TaxID=2987519 RepID=A0ABT9FUI5_9BACL|nr:iron-siderophore ABC transporter substrate-binding protein [Paenibacillus sp. P96]MDP4098393.1 iron-siderophore ABC transporter substrate-binding protein [Paenibacillus sp. P96]
MKSFSWSLLMLGLVFSLLLSACGTKEEQKNEAATETETTEKYSVEHAMGTTEITGQPQRVVILTNEGTEALLAMGVTPVGAVKSWSGNPWYEHIQDQMKDVQVVGTESEVNVEAIAALRPDLIIGSKMRQENIYEQLQAIAPTVFSDTLRGDWKENFKLYAKALNKEQEGAQVLKEYDNHVAQVKQKLGDKVNQEVSVVRFMAGKTRIYYTDSFSGVIFNELGFKRVEQQEALFTDANKLGKLAIEVGKEVTPKMDGDLLFYFTYAPDGDQEALGTEAEWTNDPLWKNLKAVQSGNSHQVSDVIWNTAGGVLAANQMLDELEKIVLAD